MGKRFAVALAGPLNLPFGADHRSGAVGCARSTPASLESQQSRSVPNLTPEKLQQTARYRLSPEDRRFQSFINQPDLAGREQPPRPTQPP